MRVLLTGASGQLGLYVRGRLVRGGHRVTAWSRGQTGDGLLPVDLSDFPGTARALELADPEVVIHTAAVSSAETVRRDPVGATVVNVEATARLSKWCGEFGRRLVYTSTDMVFDGSRPWNREDDPTAPVLAYGRTKLQAEPFVLAEPGCLVVRLSLLYGPSRGGRPTYLDKAVECWRRGEPQTFFEDEFRTPLDLATAAEAMVKLAESDASGLVHLGGRERLSRYENARRVAAALGFDPGLVRANRQRDVSLPEARPADVSLDTERLACLLPDLHRPEIEEAVTSLWLDPGRADSETRRAPVG